MKQVKRKLTLFLMNYALIPVIVILGITSLYFTRNLDLIGVWAVLLFVSLLWVLVQVCLTIGFMLMKKNLRTIIPSIVITGLAIVSIVPFALPYVNPSLLLKIYSVGFLGYLIGTGYSYKELKIKELAKLK